MPVAVVFTHTRCLRPGLGKEALLSFTGRGHHCHIPEPLYGYTLVPAPGACLAPRFPNNDILSPRRPAASRNQVYFRMSFKYREGRVWSREGHGTFSREMMLPELLWLFITPGKCGLCYFLIRLVRGAGEPVPGVAEDGDT